MLLKRQTAILDNFIKTLGNDQYMSYDELPRDLRDSLERVKCQETLSAIAGNDQSGIGATH
jgi:hypothetical protein